MFSKVGHLDWFRFHIPTHSLDQAHVRCSLFLWCQSYLHICCGGLMVKLGSTGPIYPFSPSQNFIQFLSSLCLFFGARDGFSRFLTIRRFLAVFSPFSSLFWWHFNSQFSSLFQASGLGAEAVCEEYKWDCQIKEEVEHYSPGFKFG